MGMALRTTPRALMLTHRWLCRANRLFNMANSESLWLKAKASRYWKDRVCWLRPPWSFCCGYSMPIPHRQSDRRLIVKSAYRLLEFPAKEVESDNQFVHL